MSSNFHHMKTVTQIIRRGVAMPVVVFIFSFAGCSDTNNSEYSSESNNSESKSSEFTSSGNYEDGTYCADVTYYNPNTGTRKTYSLNVEVENNELTLIHWPNGGWLDESHFSSEELDSDGYCSFTSDKGYQYQVQITGPECSFNDSRRARLDSEEETQEVTCPKCGDEKESYDTYCDSCNDKIENTCSRCGGFEYYVYGGLCSSCKAEDENDGNE